MATVKPEQENLITNKSNNNITKQTDFADMENHNQNITNDAR